MLQGLAAACSVVKARTNGNTPLLAPAHRRRDAAITVPDYKPKSPPPVANEPAKKRVLCGFPLSRARTVLLHRAFAALFVGASVFAPDFSEIHLLFVPVHLAAGWLLFLNP